MGQDPVLFGLAPGNRDPTIGAVCGENLCISKIQRLNMVRSGPHQTNPHQVEFANIHQQDDFLNLEHERDRENYQEGSVHTTHTGGSHF